jgi:hypothetical protein
MWLIERPFSQEQRRSHERLTERYDSALMKYAALPKTKEASALEEVL